MYCSTSITIHLLRGIGAIALLAIAFFITPIQPIIVLPALIGAMLLLRGCPICWLIGLTNKRSKTLSKDIK